MRIMLAMAIAASVFAGCSGAAGKGEAAAPAGAGGEQVAAASFDTSIRPVLEARCGKCHLEQSKGNFSLASLDTAIAGGKSGTAIVPNDGAHSLLYRMISGDPEVKHMPPKGEALSAEEQAAVKAWIDAGAK